MPQSEPARLHPRKTPRQARSIASVEAIHIATVQVLLGDGAARLTTTRVAERAGVSVGTLYQYYPHKQALLFAVLQRQLRLVEQATLRAAADLEGGNLRTIAHGLVAAWLEAKTADLDASRAIYAIVADFDLAELMKQGTSRLQQGIGGLLASTSDARFRDGGAIAFMIVALLGGSTRAVMELGATERDVARLREQLPRVLHGYLLSCSER